MNFALGLITLLLWSLSPGQALDISLDTSRAPDLSAFGRQVRSTLLNWYPRVRSILNSPTLRPVNRIALSFEYFAPNNKAVAYATGDRIVGSINYFRGNKDVSIFIHELVHHVQQYKKCEGWITEGIADWVRYYHFVPNRKPGKPRPGSSYRNGYGTAAYFLNWINQRHRNIIYWINKDCREGTYNDNIFPRLTGKTVDQHWNEMMRS